LVGYDSYSSEQLATWLKEELWTHQSPSLTDLQITLNLNHLDEPTEQVYAQDFLNSGQGNYKVIKSCLQVQSLLWDYVSLARQVPPLAVLAGEKIIKQIRYVNT